MLTFLHNPFHAINILVYTYQITFNGRLTFCSLNANGMLGYLRHNFCLVPLNLKLLFYKTLVHTKLEYAVSIWDPCQEKTISALGHALKIVSLCP